MPFSMADILAGYGGSPDPENPSSGEITPGLLLRALGHVAAPGQVAPPIFDPDRIGPQGSAFTPAMTAQDYASQLSAGKNKPPDPLETMLGVAGGSPATFIGPGALTWNRQAAAEAERMLAAGASRREIEAKTGTSFNAAMQPQQERSDASMTVDMNRVARAIESGERAVPAGEIYKDWHLFRDYPEMAQWPVDLNNPFFQSAQFRNQKVSGAMDMGLSPPALLINPKEVTSAADIRSMGGHELGGHGVSRIEKFPSGGGFETPVVVAQAERALPQRVEAYQKTMKDVGDRAAAWAMEQTGGDQAKAATIIHQYFDLNPDEARLMSGALQEKAKYNRGRMGLEERFKAYQSLAGESDARNIQKRLDMTPEQLAATSREDTQDIPFADQLIHYAPYNNEALPKRPTQGDFGFSTELPSFSDRMAGARDVAFAGRQRGTGNILPRETTYEPPLLAPGETMGDLQGALTPGMAPAQESIADIGRRSFRERLGLGGNERLQLSAELPPELGGVPPTPANENLLPAARWDPLGMGPVRLVQDLKSTTHPLPEPGANVVPFGRNLQLSAELPPEYDFLTGTRPDAPYPQFAEQYPATRRPTMVPRDKGPGMRPEKTLTKEAEAFADERDRIQKQMDKEGYQPYFDPSQRHPAEFSLQPVAHVDTAQALAKKQETIAKHLETIGAPETLANLRQAYSRGLDLPDSQNWYFLGQLERKAIDSLGDEAGRKWFRDNYATAMSTTTTGMNPKQNLIMGQYLNYLRTNELPFPTASHQTPVTVGGQRTMPNIEAYQKAFSDPRGPYESLGLDNPKRTDFAQAQMGNPNAFTMDEQMTSGMIGEDVPKKGTYGLLTSLGRKEAGRSGVDPQNYQDVAWAGFKKMLEEASRKIKGFRPYAEGEGYQGKPMIMEINDMIERTHRLTGMPRQEIFERGFLRHQIPLYGIGGAVTMGNVLMGQSEPPAP